LRVRGIFKCDRANTRKIVDRLKADGWISVGGGKHDKYEHPDRTNTIVVPWHKEQSPLIAKLARCDLD
jgi:predicted RNA binding protein YcfA (HicA-like mRNA interferase family)